MSSLFCFLSISSSLRLPLIFFSIFFISFTTIEIDFASILILQSARRHWIVCSIYLCWSWVELQRIFLVFILFFCSLFSIWHLTLCCCFTRTHRTVDPMRNDKLHFGWSERARPSAYIFAQNETSAAAVADCRRWQSRHKSTKLNFSWLEWIVEMGEMAAFKSKAETILRNSWLVVWIFLHRQRFVCVWGREREQTHATEKWRMATKVVADGRDCILVFYSQVRDISRKKLVVWCRHAIDDNVRRCRCCR